MDIWIYLPATRWHMAREMARLGTSRFCRPWLPATTRPTPWISTATARWTSWRWIRHLLRWPPARCSMRLPSSITPAGEILRRWDRIRWPPRSRRAPSVFYNIFGLSFADVNGDGRIDVLSQSNADSDGNAAAPGQPERHAESGDRASARRRLSIPAHVLTLGCVSTTFADLNGDGKQDLVFSYQANTFNNGVATLLGNGDGTFAAPGEFHDRQALITVGSVLLPLVTEDVERGWEDRCGAGQRGSAAGERRWHFDGRARRSSQVWLRP